MELHYNAFISYRHHPDDIRVATDIHRSLERFKVPKAIRKRGKSITRLFRDKDELPITSCLTDDITRALENSDCLIVICSVHTKESIWVQREIETFLKTHDRNRVLTVLASGEPYDVIPEILLYEDVVDPITGKIKRTDIEPLSCDWRISRKKAVREELPRLAAALLGCGYDELRQRQRQYKMRRMVAFFSAALVASLGLMAYFLHTSIQIQKANDDLYAANQKISAANEEIRQANIQIQDNLDQALRNQSEYLASSAQERLKAGDRLAAIALAMEALPQEDGERPYVPAAEQALSDALSSYAVAGTPQAQGAFRADAMVRDFKLTDDGKTVYILDARDTVTAWDTNTFQKLGSVDMTGHTVNDMSVTPAGDLILNTSDYGADLFCYDHSGTLLWQSEYTLDTAYSTNGTLLVLQYDADLSSNVLFLDPKTGCPARDSIELPDVGQERTVNRFLQEEYDLQWPLTIQYSNTEAYYLYLLDTQTQKLRMLMKSEKLYGSTEGFINCVTFNQDGNVLVLTDNGKGAMNGRYQDLFVSSPAGGRITCYNRKNGKVLWRSEITTYVYNSLCVLEQIPNTDNLLCMVGDTFQVLEGSTGKVLAECVAPSMPVVLRVEETAAWGVLQNGSYFSYSYETNICESIQYLDETVLVADINNGMFTLGELSSDVIVYRSMRDTSGQILEGDYSDTVIFHGICGDLLMIATYSDIRMVDMAEKKLLWTAEHNSTREILGFSADGDAVLVWSPYDDELIAYDARTGSSRTTQILMEEEGYYTYLDAPVYFAGDSLFYMLEAENFLKLYRYDLQTGRCDGWLLSHLQEAQEADYSKSSAIIGAKDGSVWFWRDDQTVYELCLKDGTTRELMKNAETQPKLLIEEDGRMVLAAGSRVLCMADAAVQLEITLPDVKAVSLFFLDDELLILCDDGEIYRYDSAGTLLSRTKQNLYNTFYNNVNYAAKDPMAVSWHITENGDVLINSFTAGNLMDTQQWDCRAFIPYFLAYYPEQNEVFCRAGGQLVAYKLYSAQEQMERAREALNGYELSDELKAFYGLD